ncbi:MAG: hypothetical protein JSS82_13365 [Bacteroidetes bacterium]|nr:hypothetical protein [Bacteroidota bacterium]
MFPDFGYPAAELSAYTFTIDTFIISLKNGRLTHFIPKDIEAFTAWLTNNSVRDIRKDSGIRKT